MVAKQKIVFIVAIVVFFATIATSVFTTTSVYADEYPIPASGKCNDGDSPKADDPKTCVTADTADDPDVDKKDDTASSETCAVEKIGWFVCPVLEQVAKISDRTFEVLANNFLQTDPQLASDKSGTKTAWEIARNLANVMFIIAFLAIIVSQVTSMGINNYGVKKMLPRLIVAAVAVNVSYYICQLAVDLTNIFGFEIQNALASIANSIGPSVFGAASKFGGVNHETGFGTALELIAVGALAAAGIVWLIMGPMLAILLMIIITALTIVIILLLRKALIVLLIVVSPIAFVLYLLPNTEKLFSKWLHMFIQLLLVFPVVGLLFGAGQLASTIILVSGAQSQEQYQKAQDCNPDNPEQKKAYKSGKDGVTPGPYDGCGYGSIDYTTDKDGNQSPRKATASWMLGLVAAGVAVAPLIAVWSVLKGALSAAGSIGGKIQASVTKGGNAMFAKRAEAADSARQNRMQLRGESGRGGIPGALYRRRTNKERARASVEGQVKYMQTSRTADKVRKDFGYLKDMSGGRGANADTMERVRQSALSTQRGELAEATKAAHLSVDTMTNSEDVMKIIEDKTLSDENPKLLAALERIAQVGNGNQLARAAAARASGGSNIASQTFGNAVAGNNPGYFTSTQLDMIKNGNTGGAAGYEGMAVSSIAQGIFSEQAMAGASRQHLGDAKAMAERAAAAGDPAALSTLKEIARNLQNNENLKGNIGRSRSVVDQLHPPSP